MFCSLTVKACFSLKFRRLLVDWRENPNVCLLLYGLTSRAVSIIAASGHVPPHTGRVEEVSVVTDIESTGRDLPRSSNLLLLKDDGGQRRTEGGRRRRWIETQRKTGIGE